VFPTLGDRPIATVTRDEVETVVERPDSKVRAGDLSCAAMRAELRALRETQAGNVTLDLDRR
jgi:hypothetical protein